MNPQHDVCSCKRWSNFWWLSQESHPIWPGASCLTMSKDTDFSSESVLNLIPHLLLYSYPRDSVLHFLHSWIFCSNSSLDCWQEFFLLSFILLHQSSISCFFHSVISYDLWVLFPWILKFAYTYFRQTLNACIKVIIYYGCNYHKIYSKRIFWTNSLNFE